ncbi:glycosyltransferase family 39 protein [Bacillus sp. EB600]|uniref:ArnT family glycosyltransferase n=1 Tax=Bacillus sp. EB600 TaxID=2806345 RepID=UPI00210E79F2|nr:glycosyltransferase family 39 protein [Bacillus sp. EB600]MCQ6278666.1 glycosyltransferase family 39 protein [Bacillus sp. EB600]
MQIRESIAGSILSKVLVICGFVMFLSISFFSFRSLTPVFSSKIVMIAEVFFFLCFIAIISYLINRFLTTRRYLILLIILGVGIRITWVLLIKTMPASDFSIMYESAKQAANGDYSFISNDYFSSWVYQLGFTYYEALVIKLFGDHIIVLKLLNVFFSMGTAIIIYQITKNVFNEFSARTAALLYTFYIPSIIYCSVLTNQHLSTFLFFLGMYFLVVKGLSARNNWILIGLAIGLGNIMRPAGSFFLLAICMYTLFYQIFPLRKKKSINFTTRLIGVLAVYFLVQQLVSTGLIYSGLSDKPLSNQNPYWKFAVGLNYYSNGTWNLDDQNYVGKFKLGKERNEAELSLIKERLQDKKKISTLFVNKFIAFWSDPDASISWALDKIDKPDLKQFLFKYERIIYISSCLFAIGSITLIRKRNEFSPILYILLSGYVAVHLMVEIQTRYRFDILPVLIIFAGYGVDRFHLFIQKQLRRNLI